MDRRLLIQFTGAQGVGKTTLVNSLLEKYKGYPIKGVTRELLDSGEISRVAWSKENQTRIFTEFSLRYLEALSNTDYRLIISERTFVDGLAYTRLHSKDPGLEKLATRLIQTTCIRKDIDICTIYVPPFTDIVEDDGVRDINTVSQVASLIVSILSKSRIPHIYLSSRDLNKRVLEIEQIVEARYPLFKLELLRKENQL